jgi:hypothetical protein
MMMVTTSSPGLTAALGLECSGASVSVGGGLVGLIDHEAELD